MSLTLNVLSLNCWAIPTRLACKLKDERILEIGKELAKGDYDIVLLQEVWSQRDYEKLSDKVLGTFPYTHYWHSGMFGSGVCVFSKHAILETFQHNYTVNGYAHKFLHGDWYGGKCVGLAKIFKDDFRINVYATHTHAGYGGSTRYSNNDYESHRITQAYEMSQFIRFTSEACDAVIVCGDLNFTADDLGFKMIKHNANLLDAWLTQKQNKGHQATANAKTNSFLKAGHGEACIDFILYRPNSGNSITCEKCEVAMGRVPDKDYNYSDHEGVATTLTLKKIVTVMSSLREPGEIEKHFSDAVPILDAGIKHVKADQVFYAALFILSLTLLMFSADFMLPWGLNLFLVFMRIGLLAALGFSFWMGIVMANREMSSLLAAKKDINNLLKANPSIDK